MAQKITRIEVIHHDEAGPREEVTFFFDDGEEPFSAREFLPDTPTRNRLNDILDAISLFNTIEERGEWDRYEQPGPSPTPGRN